MTAINGHRGARNLWPENSLPGFRNALQLGCDAIEFDVHLTDAGELVVIHDPLLDRTTDGTGPVRALTPETRRRTLLKDSDTVVPTLGEVLEVLAPVHGLGLHVEIKLDEAGLPYPGIAARVADALISHGLERRAHLTSFDAGILREGYNVIGRMADHAVLIIDEADAVDSCALRQPDQVGRMVIAQRPGSLARKRGFQRRDPGIHEGKPLARIGRALRRIGEEPVEQKLRLDGERLEIIAMDLVGLHA